MKLWSLFENKEEQIRMLKRFKEETRKQTLKDVLEKYQKTNEYTLGERLDKLEDFEEWLEKEIKKLGAD